MIKTTVTIEGMMCGMCESHINDAIRQAFQVKKVNSSQKKNETVILSEEKIAEDKLKEVIDKTGYQMLAVTVEPYEKKGFFGHLIGKNSKTQK